MEKRASIIKLNVLTAADENTVKAKIDELARKVRDARAKTSPRSRRATHKTRRQAGGDIGWIKKEPEQDRPVAQRVYNNDMKSTPSKARSRTAGAGS